MQKRKNNGRDPVSLGSARQRVRGAWEPRDGGDAELVAQPARASSVRTTRVRWVQVIETFYRPSSCGGKV